MKKIAIILSGSGVMDGSEIHEATACLLACSRAGVSYQCLAPNMSQAQVVNHVTNEKLNESRNILVEAARIARGNIKNIASVSADDFDAAVYPGGYGVVHNLCNFATQGADCEIQKDVLKFAKAMAAAQKPQGFSCIAPVMIAKIYGPGVEMTIGTDVELAKTMEKMGDKPVAAQATDIVVDEQHKVVTTPVYMCTENIAEVFAGIEKMVNKVVELI